MAALRRFSQISAIGLLVVLWLRPMDADDDHGEINGSHYSKSKSPQFTLPNPDDYDLIERFKQQLQLTLPTGAYPNLECDKDINTTAIRFIIYTRSAPGGYAFTTGDYVRLKGSTFNVKKATTFLVHGWFQDGASFASPFVNAYFKKESMNVISVDWGYYSRCEFFYTRNRLIPLIGKLTSEVIKMLINYGSTLESFHLIGHSFGSHIVGYAGYNMLPRKLPRITGTDPAGPTYYLAPNNKRLSREDARFVDIIHTNAGEFGLDELLGHADFFVNGGSKQPACNPIDVKCSHQISNEYYVESISNPHAFCASECANNIYYEKNLCHLAPKAYMGEYVSNTTFGKFYVDTNKRPPYGLGC